MYHGRSFSWWSVVSAAVGAALLFCMGCLFEGCTFHGHFWEKQTHEHVHVLGDYKQAPKPDEEPDALENDPRWESLNESSSPSSPEKSE